MTASSDDKYDNNGHQAENKRIHTSYVHGISLAIARSIAPSVFRARIDRDLVQEDVGIVTYKDRGTISKIESGRLCSFPVILYLTTMWKIPLADLPWPCPSDLHRAGMINALLYTQRQILNDQQSADPDDEVYAYLVAIDETIGASLAVGRVTNQRNRRDQIDALSTQLNPRASAIIGRPLPARSGDAILALYNTWMEAWKLSCFALHITR